MFFFFVVRLFRPAVHLLLRGVIPDLARVLKVGQKARHAPAHGGGELGGGAEAPPIVLLLECRISMIRYNDCWSMVPMGLKSAI